MYTGTALVGTRKLKDSVAASGCETEKAVEAGRPSQPARKAPMAPCSASAPPAAAPGSEMAMLSARVLLALMGVLEADQEAEGEGGPPGALGVVEGEGVLEAEGRLVMEALG